MVFAANGDRHGGGGGRQELCGKETDGRTEGELSGDDILIYGPSLCISSGPSFSLSPLFLYSSEDARKTGPSVRHGPRRDTVKPGPNWARSFLSRYAPIIPIYLG